MAALDYNTIIQQTTTDPKQQLWQAVHKGDYETCKRLIDANTLGDINEYNYGITLLHALVYGDRVDIWDDAAAFKIVIADKIKIAEFLLSKGANLDLPAITPLPWAIGDGQTAWEMAAGFDQLPWYHRYVVGMRASLVYTGEHVLPIFKKHLGIEDPPSMLAQFGDFCNTNRVPLAIAATVVTTAVVASRYRKARTYK